MSNVDMSNYQQHYANGCGVNIILYNTLVAVEEAICPFFKYS